MDLILYPLVVGAILVPTAWIWRGRDRLDALALGAGAGIILWGSVGLARFFVLLPNAGPKAVGLATLALAITAGVALTLLTAGRPQAPRAPHPVPGRLMVAVAGTAAMTLGLEASLPHFDLAARLFDWYMHYDLARFYETATDLGRRYGDAGITTRTPLFNLLGAVVLSLFGERFSVFQVLTAAVGWLWVLPFALLARRLVPNAATPVIALAGLSPLVLHAHTFTWSKGLVTFLALLALERFLALRDALPGDGCRLALQLGAIGGAALLTHQGFIGYPGVLVALLAYDVAKRRRRWIELGVAGAMAAVMAAPWYAWSVAQYGWQEAFFSYPRVLYASPLRWAFDRFLILASSAFPLNVPIDRLTNAQDPLQDYFLAYLGTAAGVLGLAFLLRTLAFMVRRRTRFGVGPEELPVLCFAAGGSVGGALLLGGLAENNAASFCIPALLGLLLLAVRVRPPTRWWVYAAVVEASVLEAVALAWVWSPSSTGQNALLAMLHGIVFLGRDTVWVGVPLLVAGGVGCIASATMRARPAQSALHPPAPDRMAA